MSLSPAAQAVRDAFFNGPDDFTASIAATLHAAADQVVPEDDNEPNLTEFSDRELLCNWCEWGQRRTTRNRILAIAAELEGSNAQI